MRYTNVCIEAIGCTLPEEIVTSDAIETALEPLYSRLRLPAGRLELMTGIRARRFWPPGTLPSGPSVASAEQAIAAAGIDRREIGALVHGSVCRDHLEPATAAAVHHRLGLSSDCLIYDVSNACLGLLNGMVQVANMIELGQIRAGLVVGTESARPLVETTIASLNANMSLSRDSVKMAVASLTIGSGSAAIVLADRRLSRTGNRLTTAIARAETAGHRLCHSGRDEAVADGMHPLMHTDSERLMRDGVAAALPAFEDFLDATGWTHDGVDKTFCHQVGVAHRRLLFETLGLDPSLDFATVETLGNTGSVALPMTMALGIEQGHLSAGDRVAMLGIGSGINVLMLGVEWQTSPVTSKLAVPAATPLAISRVGHD
ncbi:MAG TPA: 3-oxoacyl-ACP synthase III [Pirellulales bacterium]|nr:3-oxoacyl-ACP synthase III [Pirellulales bacterium]